jgi:hypothetical protein
MYLYERLHDDLRYAAERYASEAIVIDPSPSSSGQLQS